MRRLRDNLPSAATNNKQSNSTCALFLVRGRGTPLPDTRSVTRAAAAARVVSSVASDIVFPPGWLFTPRPESRFVSSAHKEKDASPVGTHFAATGPDRCARKKALLSLLYYSRPSAPFSEGEDFYQWLRRIRFPTRAPLHCYRGLILQSRFSYCFITQYDTRLVGFCESRRKTARAAGKQAFKGFVPTFPLRSITTTEAG